MHTRSSDLPQKSFQIKQDDKFYSRLLSKESSIANSSFRVYYGVAAGAVPFMWESQPGTPKHPISNTTLPPLTPPPSYYNNYQKNPTKKHSKSSLLNTVLPRLCMRKAHVTPSSSSSSSSQPLSSSSQSSSYYSLSSSSFPSSPSSTPSRPSILRRRSRLSIPRLSFSSSMEDDEYPATGSPTSPFCFPSSRETKGGHRRCYSMVGVKNALLSIVGHGSSQGTTA
ncbi:TPRXL protein [Cinnamomum micranthum f. kanehirae]|uniref:TPRXL protein n=1 Tax=Cinnamomum micranthum f. kanehirae TaxID=337451 RepID=A0A443NKH1_9MAGN|nr:TPRXL protein [Cinnamomum micranthum f. kanehirae]